MKKRVMALVVALMVVFVSKALGVTVQDYTGEWKAVRVNIGGADMTVEDAGIDLSVRFDGAMGYLTSETLGVKDEANVFKYDGGVLSASNADGSFQMVYNEKDDTVQFTVFASGGTGVFQLERVGKKKDSMVKTGLDEAVSSKSTNVTIESAQKPAAAYDELKRGDKGDEVQALQERLIELKWLEGTADGDYGPKTETAVKDFQGKNGLKETGIADGKTQKVLFSSSAKKKKVYGKLSFNTISRDPDLYEGELFRFSGTVVQVLESGNYVEMRVATKDGYDNIVYVTYTRSDGESRILEDDKVSVYGKFKGLKSYEAIFGNTVTLPWFEADSVSVK